MMEPEILPEPVKVPPKVEMIDCDDCEFAVKLTTDGTYWLGPVEGNA